MITAREWNDIRRLVMQMANVILSGQTAATNIENEVGTESIDNLYPGHPTIEKRPVAHPYGYVSRAPKGTGQVVGRQGEHPANRIVLLHRDQNRPAIGDGDVWLYDNHGNQLQLKSGKIVAKLAAGMELGEGATKGVARMQDPVTVNVTPADIVALAMVSDPVTGAVTGVGGTLTGTIAQGSSKVTCVD